jgi:hypothetical protein
MWQFVLRVESGKRSSRLGAINGERLVSTGEREWFWRRQGGNPPRTVYVCSFLVS